MKLTEIYSSSGVNRSPHCLSWKNDFVIYGSCNGVKVIRVSNFGECVNHQTLIHGHTDRVNCVHWIHETLIASGSSDCNIVLWRRSQNDIFTKWNILQGHTGSVTMIDSLEMASQTFLLASTSGDSSIRIWKNNENEEIWTNIQTIALHGISLSVKLGHLPISLNPFLLYSHVNGSLYLSVFENSSFQPFVHSFKGHEDWIQDIDLMNLDNGDILIASGSQDTHIRIWRIANNKNIQVSSNEIRRKEEYITTQDSEYSVTLESILSGHSDKVYGVSFARDKDGKIHLLSSSFDKTMILWREEPCLWIESTRVGEVGGNTLGLMGCALSGNASQFIGYSFNGACHLWNFSNGKWTSGIVMAGHHGSVEDIDWEFTGKYLLSVSSDQTTRLHGPWKKDNNEVQWIEIARPQVHGYNLQCISTLPNHSFVSGAEEKIARVFQGTRNFIENFTNISQIQISVANMDHLAIGASVPSLGLSNKGVFESNDSVSLPEKHILDDLPDSYFIPTSYKRPPPEEILVQNTLWSELHKLYGHGYEMFKLASSTSGRFVASSCKASKSDHAEIYIWNTVDWTIFQKLHRHNLTVTALAFSPNERYFLSGSRDRTWNLYEFQNDSFVHVGGATKKTNSHSRIIWDVSFSHDSQFFVTVSRDKKLNIWNVKNLSEFVTSVSLEDSITSVSFASDFKNESYVLAAGLDNGKIHIFTFDLITHITHIFNSHDFHYKTVKRLKFTNGFRLASCSSDHSVRIYDLK